MILLLGSSGYVGRRFDRFLRARQVPVTSPLRADTDYTRPEEIRRLLREVRPSFVINAAGYTGKPTVDACEVARADTLEGNTLLPLRIAEACRGAGVPLGHISSGCIYQGEGTGPGRGFTENDPANFSFFAGEGSFYSGTKALAEEFLRKISPDIYIWRLRIPFDAINSRRNYLSKLMTYERLLNVRNSLSNLDDFVAAAVATYERRLDPGTYNLTNPGSVTTREVVELIQEEGERRKKTGDIISAKRMLKSFSYFDSEEEFMRSGVTASRSSCVLDTTKAEEFGLPLRPVREALVDSLRRWSWEGAP